MPHAPESQEKAREGDNKWLNDERENSDENNNDEEDQNQIKNKKKSKEFARLCKSNVIYPFELMDMSPDHIACLSPVRHVSIVECSKGMCRCTLEKVTWYAWCFLPANTCSHRWFILLCYDNSLPSIQFIKRNKIFEWSFSFNVEHTFTLFQIILYYSVKFIVMCLNYTSWDPVLSIGVIWII